jgi:hypothetical protein
MSRDDERVADDPIREALSAVGDDHVDDPTGDEPSDEQVADAVPGADDLEKPDEESGRISILSWARRVPDGSHRDFDATDWWDPEGGGKNRLAFHLSDATSAGVGYPNALGVLVGFAELYFGALQEGEVSALLGSSSDGDDSKGGADGDLY